MTQQGDELEELAPVAPSFTSADVDDLDDQSDPTSPPAYAGAADDEESIAEFFDGIENPEDDAEWTPDDAILDFTGTLAVWVNEEGILQRAQLVRYWRDRAKQFPLEAMFDDVFHRINQEFPAQDYVIPQPNEFDSSVQLDGGLLDEVHDASATLDERLAELEEADEGYSEWRGEPLTVRDSRGRVSITLDMFGLPQSVEIDPRAVDELTGIQICASVMDAYQRARARFEPPEFVPGERFKIAEKYLTLTAIIEAAAANGISYLPDLTNNPAYSQDKTSN